MAGLQQFKKITTIIAILSVIILLYGCKSIALQEAPFSARVSIEGDIMSPFLFTGEEFTTDKVIHEGEEYALAITLKEIIDKAAPINEEYTVLLIGRDGLRSEIEGENLEDCFLAYTPKLGWQHITDIYPISSKIKLLDKIIVISKDTKVDGVSFGGNTKSSIFTPGQVYREKYQTIITQSGRSQVDGEFVTVYTQQIGFEISHVMDYKKTVAIFTKDGQIFHDRPGEKSLIVIEKNSISYIKSTGEKIEKIKGILADPPLSSITDTYNDALNEIKRNKKVLVIELDGWGEKIALYARDNKASPYLSSLEYRPAMSVYPTVSTAGLAAMITGVSGSENGIISRKDKDLRVKDIFAVVEEMGKKSIYIEGSVGLLNTSLKPILSPDSEIDDENVFKNTMKALEGDSDLIFTHFHSIDNIATTYGPYAQETMDQITIVDDMIRQLVNSFEGTVIITADHGLHKTEDGGYHGIVSQEDSIVPYIILKDE